MESGLVTTGASVSVQGTVKTSPGSKQKVELGVEKLVTVKYLMNLSIILMIIASSFCILQF